LTGQRGWAIILLALPVALTASFCDESELWR
jgi:hypothetical protein